MSEMHERSLGRAQKSGTHCGHGHTSGQRSPQPMNSIMILQVLVLSQNPTGLALSTKVIILKAVGRARLDEKIGLNCLLAAGCLLRRAGARLLVIRLRGQELLHGRGGGCTKAADCGGAGQRLCGCWLFASQGCTVGCLHRGCAKARGGDCWLLVAGCMQQRLRKGWRQCLLRAGGGGCVGGYLGSTVKEKKWVVFKGEDDPTSIPVEWICWLNGQRKTAPTPEGDANINMYRQAACQYANRADELQTRKQYKVMGRLSIDKAPVSIPKSLSCKEMSLNNRSLTALFNKAYVNPFGAFAVAFLKKEEEERRAKEVSSHTATKIGKVDVPDLRSYTQQFPDASKGRGDGETSGAMDGRNSEESETDRKDSLQPKQPESSEPIGSGESFRPETWQPPT
ncbi:NADH:ubiquinone oxidoreductase, 17.2kDa subunit [Actinidia rufa]|uniref:NADH:ubiquinone oxidoreductase, 17.2kDa subunit n=1 Tax=Actinidia rufa TaxID=165716 RepID=A0A7J0G2A8_9ERIC|nr:NADH:ubiquinone oxidoreductase, 17.2kDa subunit [Actinidia rufa]